MKYFLNYFCRFFFLVSRLRKRIELLKEILAVTNHVVDITNVEDSSTFRTSCTLTSGVIEAYDIVKMIGNISHIHRAYETDSELENHLPHSVEL